MSIKPTAPTTMSLRQFSKAVKEIRLHLCQSGASSAGVR